MLLVLTDLIIKNNLFVVSSGGLVHRHRGTYVTELRSCIARRSENGARKSELVENVKAIKHNAGAKDRCGHPSMKKRTKTTRAAFNWTQHESTKLKSSLSLAVSDPAIRRKRELYPPLELHQLSFLAFCTASQSRFSSPSSVAQKERVKKSARS